MGFIIAFVILICIVSIFVIAYVSNVSAEYEIHKEMSKDWKPDSGIVAYGTFNDFLYKFNQRSDWEPSKDYEGSFFTKQTLPETVFRPVAEIHAGLIRFENNMMVMKTFKDWCEFREWQKKTWKIPKDEILSKYKWTE